MNRLKELREQKNVSMRQIAASLKLPYTTYVNYEKGLREPNSETLIQLAKFFDVTVDYLIGRADSLDILNVIPLPKTKNIPLLGSIACGEPILAEQNIEFYLRADENVKADFALRCKGDSMINARIFDGDIVYIHSQPTVENGEIAAVLIGNEATLKKVHHYNNKIVLSPCNPMYENIIYENEQLSDVRILGKAIYFVSEVR